MGIHEKGSSLTSGKQYLILQHCRATIKRQFTLNHYVPKKSRWSISEWWMLSCFLRNLLIFKLGSRNWLLFYLLACLFTYLPIDWLTVQPTDRLALFLFSLKTVTAIKQSKIKTHIPTKIKIKIYHRYSNILRHCKNILTCIFVQIFLWYVMLKQCNACCCVESLL